MTESCPTCGQELPSEDEAIDLTDNDEVLDKAPDMIIEGQCQCMLHIESGSHPGRGGPYQCQNTATEETSMLCTRCINVCHL